MSDTVKRLKANKSIEGTLCGWCSKPMVFGDDTVICQACELTFHAACWDEKAGCVTSGCANAPLKQLEPEAGPPKKEIPTNRKECPHCGKLISKATNFCIHCKRATTPDGIYRGPKANAPGAVASLVWGSVGMFICGFILGIIAIVKSSQAKKAIEADPRLGGAGLATAGMVLGIIAIVLHALFLIVRIGAMSQMR